MGWLQTTGKGHDRIKMMSKGESLVDPGCVRDMRDGESHSRGGYEPPALGVGQEKILEIQGKAKYPGKDTVSHVQKEEYFLTSSYCKEGTQESNCARQGS